jgi:hypothetical protein
MEWVKTAEKLPEDQAGKSDEDCLEILISTVIDGKRFYETANYEHGIYYLLGRPADDGWQSPDLWCQIQPPQ